MNKLVDLFAGVCLSRSQLGSDEANGQIYLKCLLSLECFDGFSITKAQGDGDEHGDSTKKDWTIRGEKAALVRN